MCFYDRLRSVLIEGGFRRLCRGGLSVLLRGQAGGRLRCRRGAISACTWWATSRASTLSAGWNGAARIPCRYGSFLRLESRDRVPDHSWLSRTRARLPHEVHTAIFDWVLALIAEAGLVKGERIGVDASTMEANAALRNIVRRGHGRGFTGGCWARLAQESGIETPTGRGTWRAWTASARARSSRTRTGSRRATPAAKIAKMKDGTTHLAYKPEHAVDLDTGAVVAAELHPADEGDHDDAGEDAGGGQGESRGGGTRAPTAEDPAECVDRQGAITHGRS